MLESSPALFYLASPVDFTALYLSPQAEAMLGYSMAEWSANPGLWAEILHPDDRARVRAEFEEAARGGRPFRAEYRLLTKAGEVRWVRDHAALVDDASGRGKLIQGVVLDITGEVVARESAERATRASAATTTFFDSVFEYLPLGVAKVDLAMKVTAANARLGELLWTREGNMVGASVAEFLEPEDLVRVIEEFRPLFRGAVDRIESTTHARRTDGERVWLHWTATTVRRPDGVVDHFLAMFEDITAKHAAEATAIENLAAVERLNRLKSEFVSVVSHEFRTALTGIQGFSEMLRDAKLTSAQVREFATDINNDALRLNRMITEMLDLDRIESGMMTLNLAAVDVNAVIGEAVDRAKASGGSTHQFELVLDPKLPLITADGDRAFQVVANLLSNAVKYSPGGGRIIIRSRAEPRAIVVSVQDHGMGIAPAFIDRVFERYERYASKATDRILGTGLGLAIAREIVEMHGGTIGVESTEGQGSVFHFTLPRVHPPEVHPK
jgi:PAS domain S-box-containing protein